MVSNVALNLIAFWDSVGLYDFFLPFLLIFALTFGIMNYGKFFGENKGVRVIISLVIGLLATRIPYFTDFYSQIFPRLGIGLVVLLSLMILLGLFFTKESSNLYWYVFAITGAIIGIVVLYTSFNFMGWLGGYASVYNGGDFVFWVITVLAAIGVIIAVVASNSSGGGSKPASRATFGPMYEVRGG